MKQITINRLLLLALAVCLMLCLLPSFVAVEAEAVSGVNDLTCESFISNPTRQNYIDTMMRYYINNNSKLSNTLDNGYSVVFMFEGGSDKYDDYKYVDACGSYRVQAVCIVVQKNSSGKAEIVFHNEYCSSIPDDANWSTPGYESSGSTTILDGIYSMQTVNHNGKYAGYNTDCYTGWYIPYSGSTGYAAYCDGINIHTRSGGTCGGASYGWCNSAGCQVIDYGTSNNGYNDFMKITAGITWDAYGTYYNTFASVYNFKGYYVVDRQLGLLSPSGVEYGSGSLIELYGKADLAGITKFSTEARANANFGYLSQCTAYDSHCTVEMTMNTEVNSLPCSVGTDEECAVVEYCSAGDTYEATALYRNSYGNLWYEVISKSGETGYVYAGECKYIENLTDDITLSSGTTAPNGHVAGNIFVVNGNITSKYSGLTEASVYVYQGFGTSGTPVTGDSDTVGGHSYTLDNSTIDYNTSFNTLTSGKYTYAISTKFTNYYASDATTLQSVSGTVDLMTEYFMVIPSSVSQSSCAHSYATTTIRSATCTATGQQVKSCATCGKVVEETVPKLGHAYSGWTTTQAATCTRDGSKTRTCSTCGNVETQTVAAQGHKYSAATLKETCQSHGGTRYTCSVCGDTYDVYADSKYTAWSASKPTGVAENLIQTKLQYRYADQVTTTSTSPTLSGYEMIASAWDSGTPGTLEYAPDLADTGFSTANSLYSKYNKSKLTASTSETQKTVINTDKHTGYLYYHWCYADSYYCVESQSGSYTTFHAYYDTTDPDSFTCDTSDMSYKTSHSTCSNSEWWFVTDVYTQSYTTYNKVYTHAKWGSWSAWSDSEVTASDTRKVETQTLYRYVDAPFGDHTYVDGVCSVCGTADPDYQEPTVPSEPAAVDYYLIGYINGADYGCESDYQNMGQYKFTDGKLVATFTQDSYVFLKTTDNGAWYMTETYVTGTSANYYNTLTGASEKMLVPGGKEITFTLVENGDGSLTLSYVAREETVTPTGTVEPKSATLSLEDEVLINLYFIVEEMDVTSENVGMLIYNEKPETANVATADTVIEGGLYNESNGRYMVSTPGIPGQYLADSLYLVAYAKDANGNYVYARTVEYSGKKYCTSQMTKGTAELKATCVALMNYGAAAQQYFAATTDYTYDTLMNVDFAQYQNLVVDYSESLLAVRGTVDSAKAGTLGTTVNGFTRRSVSMSADGDFSLNYYLTTDKAADKVTFYYWTAEQYASVSKLTLQNASGSKEMVLTDGTNRYWANVSGIAAKDIDQTVYACGVYEKDGVTYTSGVFSYSIGYYCTSKAAGTDETVKPFAKAIAVYSYHARIFLESLN